MHVRRAKGVHASIESKVRAIAPVMLLRAVAALFSQLRMRLVMSPQVSDLLGKFQFIPSWRVDDIMVSYAPKGGSVGPHVDNYDVFLLQVKAKPTGHER